jgi:hypothetical protein
LILKELEDVIRNLVRVYLERDLEEDVRRKDLEVDSRK